MLRAHARRAVLARASAPAAQTEAHLDADELSAYAEHALPASMRAHYAEHLAGCDDCRQQVVVLARAAGVADQIERQAEAAFKPAPAASWRARLAALFAPGGAWRYAMPLIALLAVSGVVLWSMTGLREQRAGNATEIASAPQTAKVSDLHHAPDEQPQQPETTVTSDLATANTNTANDARASVTNRQGGSAGAVASGTPTGLIALNEAPPQPSPAAMSASQPVTNTDSLAAVNQNVPNLNAGAGLNSQSNTQQTALPPSQYAQEPPAAAPVMDGLNKDQAKTEVAKAPTTTQPSADKRADEEITYAGREARKEREEARARGRDDEDIHGPSRAMSAKPKSVSPPPKEAGESDATATRSARRRPDATGARRAETTDESTETRSIAGRQFRRQKNAWVDTAYRAGQATVNVRRDTDQWRALVADEPDLRRIAEALGGEVVVVWSGRAYRIR